MYIPYHTATMWQAYYASLNNVGLSDDQKVQIDILGTLENQSGTGGGNTENAKFNSQNDVYTYNVGNAPQLANLVGKTVIACFVGGGTIDPSAITWDDTDMVFDSNAVTFDGTQTIVVLAQ